MKKTYFSHNYKKCLNLFVLSVSSILLRAYNTFKQQMLAQGPLETGTFTSQVSKKPKYMKTWKVYFVALTNYFREWKSEWFCGH